MQTKLLWLLAVVAAYLLIKYFVPFGAIVVYPIALLVTFLHEFGHAMLAIITRGDVYAIQINPNGSGFAKIAGGNTPLVLMGGYVGSAILGNMLLFIGLIKPQISKIVTIVLALLMIFVGLWWFSSVFTTVLLFLFAALLIYISRKQQSVASYFLSSIGLLSLIYIVEDYNVGPSSDIHKFSELLPFLPESVWMYSFLAIVIFISYLNIKTILKIFKKTTEKGSAHAV